MKSRRERATFLDDQLQDTENTLVWLSSPFFRQNHHQPLPKSKTLDTIKHRILRSSSCEILPGFSWQEDNLNNTIKRAIIATCKEV